MNNSPEIVDNVFERVEKIVQKEENAYYQHFSPSPTIISKALFFSVIKTQTYPVKRDNSLGLTFSQGHFYQLLHSWETVFIGKHKISRPKYLQFRNRKVGRESCIGQFHYIIVGQVQSI